MKLSIPLIAATLAVCSASAQAATLTVGPYEAITRIAEAARLAKDGDTVLIQPGTYRGDVAVWRQRSLDIRGIGQRPVLEAAGASAEDKGTWVFAGGRFRVANIEFRGARATDHNGAGIRLEKGHLEVGNCVFEDNETAILTGNDGEAELRVRDSIFSRAPQDSLSLHHLLYAGRIRHLSVEGSRFHGGYLGHLLKSRAARSEIRYNLLVDGREGRASYELEFPNGGVALVVGNVIGQSRASANITMVAYGAESAVWPENRLVLSHNTLISEGWRPALFARVWGSRLPASTTVVTRNNLLAGFGLFDLVLPGVHQGNHLLLPGTLETESFAFSLPEDSPLRGQVVMSSPATEAELVPTAEFSFPVGTTPLVMPAKWAPGAFQSVGIRLRPGSAGLPSPSPASR
ncbi:hypothetical protein [Zoogloea sp.]|uniref:hypothetical protein n=1 Tax=Zoogloea sp. TaxID=49181 RepID=UPI00141629C0|nr:MAG: hypothetical protein F9K15_14745 [Zoogloea sp.]